MPLLPVLAFDIETIPDIAGLRLLKGVPATQSDVDVLADELAQREAQGRSDFLPHHLQRVVVIGCVFRNAEGLRVHSFVDRGGDTAGVSDEARIIQQFYASVERHAPQLVSWNGGGFDLPVLHWRGLKHGVAASRYWDFGEDDREFKWNNYISRYPTPHLDLMDLLSMYQPRASAPLDAMAKLCGFPGKLGMDGSQVHAQWRDGRIEDIRRYCETDVMNTYLLYCRFQKMRGAFDDAEYRGEIAYVRESLGALARAGEAHWAEYLDAWPG
jgi:predicted PolB exonuclease-like 3'-5' exonuclease